jgi:hypothetical protein
VTTQTSERSRVLEALASSHNAFRDAVTALDDAKMASAMDGGWSVREVVAHLIGWDELGARDFERLARGHQPVLAAYRHEDVDEWNKGHVRGRGLFPQAQLISELDAAWTALQESMRPLPDSLFAEGQLVRTFCDIGVQHKDAHAEELRRLGDRTRRG